MNFESRFYISNINNLSEIYENNEYDKKSLESLKKQDACKCYQILVNYMVIINQI